MIRLPTHIAMQLEHNMHAVYYESVEQSISSGTYTRDGFISEAEYSKAMLTNECWTLTWYPDTPVGHIMVHAASLTMLLAWIDEQGYPEHPHIENPPV